MEQKLSVQILSKFDEGYTCTGRSPLLVTFSRIRSRPLLRTTASLRVTMAPGALSLANSDGSICENTSGDGMGKKEPYKAASRSPSSVQIGL
jgi:hypothetical protein